VIINISASPYHAGKGRFREQMIATRASDNASIVAFCNLVGGQDELVFDGHSVIFDQSGAVLARGKQFEEDLIVADLDLEAVFRTRLHDPRRRKEKLHLSQKGANNVRKVRLTGEPAGPSSRESEEGKCSLPERSVEVLEETEEIYRALVLGTRDYVRKNGFEKVVLGLSGGIDSSLTAVIAVDALGVDNVIGVVMPSRFSSDHSREDAYQLGENLGLRVLTLTIEEPFQAYLQTLSEVFEGREPDVAEENLQARIRGNLLMALSNKFGWRVVATGNKSESSVGYCTLYGDMSGGLSIIKDVPKMLVYQLSNHRNRAAGVELIPKRVMDKEPSAELRANQRDVDSLPPYPILDGILKAYVEEDRSVGEIVGMGFDDQLVRRVVRLVDVNEYKRRQASPGIKITPRAFGKDRRLPITNSYRESST
ncbi:MAG: NAD+ synthase, partial [Armatimonadetes bacterium]|nr:NAD+ synthase [Armatimonadota bacterium]